jgi:hypothetical protein
MVLPNGERRLVTREVVEQVDVFAPASGATAATYPPGTRYVSPPPAAGGQTNATAATLEDDRLAASIRTAIENFRNAEGEANTQARRRLESLLRSYFERDVSRRASEIDKLEEQVRNLRAQLGRRREKRQELIDLQMKLIENEIEGLGFFVAPPGPQSNPPAMRDWYGRVIPPEGPQAMNPPATRDWIGRWINPPSDSRGQSLPPQNGAPIPQPQAPPQNRQPIGPDDALLGPVNPPVPYPPVNPGPGNAPAERKQ